jgi:hypothetical protein
MCSICTCLQFATISAARAGMQRCRLTYVVVGNKLGIRAKYQHVNVILNVATSIYFATKAPITMRIAFE